MLVDSYEKLLYSNSQEMSSRGFSHPQATTVNATEAVTAKRQDLIKNPLKRTESIALWGELVFQQNVKRTRKLRKSQTSKQDED
jgi:hypothetical protein